MTKVINGEVYYTLEESSSMLDISIEKSADLLISELKEKKENRKINNKELMYV